MIFGESAGAMSVAYQILYNDGNVGGIFRIALMESGSLSTYAAKPASYPPRQTAYNFIAATDTEHSSPGSRLAVYLLFPTRSIRVDCVKDRSILAPTLSAFLNDFECLRNANTDTLRQANYDVVKVPANLRAPDPYPAAIGLTLSAGDPFLSRPPKLSIRQGKFAKVPFVCSTWDEGAIFTTNPGTTSEVVTFLTAQLPGLTFGVTNTTIVNQLLGYYPADPDARSPYITGNDTFRKAAQYKRAGSVIGDLVLDAPPRDFLQVATSLNVSVCYQFAQTGLDAPEYAASYSFELPLTPAYKLNPGAAGDPNRAAWPSYGTGKSLQLKAGNTTVIPDTFRTAGMIYIISKILT
ncbi:hypothetical protein FS749_005767 [Ceratobasidium sp. UAMH 11750]|nr:hypothetical protein FS749_005767 [Ceratobasidium sp. UAMH 11750]